MLRGVINEYSEWPGIRNFEPDLPFQILSEGVRLRNLTDNVVLYQDDSLKTYCHGLDGIWLQCGPMNKTKEVFLDIYERGLRHNDDDVSIIGSKFIGSKRVFTTEQDDGKDQLNIFDYNTKEKYSVELNGIVDFSVNQQYIIVLDSFEGQVTCFNMQAELLWKNEYGSRINLGRAMIRLPQFYKETVVINLGADEKSKQDGMVVCLQNDTGQEVWLRKFTCDTLSTLINDKVYIAHDGKGIFLDAATGETLLEVDPGIAKTSIDDTFWTNGRYLCYCSYFEATFFLFDPISGSLLQRLKVPHPFYLSPAEYPVFWQDKIYVSVGLEDMGLKGAVYGMLTLEEAVNNDDAKIMITPRPEHVVLTVPEDEGEGYHLIINDIDLEKVIRYGELIIQSYAMLRGRHDFEDEQRQNKNFNGHIYFSAPLDKLDPEAGQALDAMAAKLEEWCDEFVFASTDTGPISVKIVPMPELTEGLLKNTAPPLEYK